MKKLICILMIFYSFNAHAQAGDTGDGGGVTSDFPVDGGLSMHVNPQAPEPADGDGTSSDIPVDGGLSLLLAAGAAYGARRVRRKPKA